MECITLTLQTSRKKHSRNKGILKHGPRLLSIQSCNYHISTLITGFHTEGGCPGIPPPPASFSPRITKNEYWILAFTTGQRSYRQFAPLPPQKKILYESQNQVLQQKLSIPAANTDVGEALVSNTTTFALVGQQHGWGYGPWTLYHCPSCHAWWSGDILSGYRTTLFI